VKSIIKVNKNVEKHSIIQVGGNVENAIKGEYNIDVKGVLSEAWQQTKVNRKTINTGLIIIFSFGLLLTLFGSQLLGGAQAVLDDPKLSMLLNVAITMAIWPFLAGVEMMGVLNAVGLSTKATFIFSFLKRGSWVALCALLTSLLIGIGFELFILPGVFLAVVFSLTIPLVVEKAMTPWQAMIISIQALRFSWLKILQLYMFLAIILVISFIPLILLVKSPAFIIPLVLFLFTLSYLAPMFYHVKGILYREIFGMNLRSISKDSLPNRDDTFNA
jgi:hypothetical protein